MSVAERNAMFHQYGILTLDDCAVLERVSAMEPSASQPQYMNDLVRAVQLLMLNVSKMQEIPSGHGLGRCHCHGGKNE